MTVLILKTKSFCQVIKITLTVLMVSQHQQVQPTQDIAERLTGQEREVLIITQVVAPINNTPAFTGLVLLSATAPTARGMSASMVTSTTTPSAARAAVCVPAFQSRLRSLRSNNQRINHRLSSKIIRGGET